MTEYLALFGFLGGLLACYQLNRLSKHRTIQVMDSKIAQLRSSVRELEQKLATIESAPDAF